jgi:hypothetical protein
MATELPIAAATRSIGQWSKMRCGLPRIHVRTVLPALLLLTAYYSYAGPGSNRRWICLALTIGLGYLGLGHSDHSVHGSHCL